MPSNRTRPRIQRLPATHLKQIERARSNQGNTVVTLFRNDLVPERSDKYLQEKPLKVFFNLWILYNYFHNYWSRVFQSMDSTDT